MTEYPWRYAEMRNPSRVDAVVFDCDSTLCAIEGIDELAGPLRAEVQALTDSAMHGEVPLEAVYGRRLELIRPGRARLEELSRRYVQSLVPDAAAVVTALRDSGIAVRVISGGLRPAVLAAARALSLDDSAVAAVDIRFSDDGAYAGFDEGSPLARAGGKCDVLAAWRSELGEKVMLVGDGATDLEAARVVSLFVAYTGVVERAAVVAGADVVIRSRSLAPVLPIALGGTRPSSAHVELYERGLALLDEADRLRLTHTNP